MKKKEAIYDWVIYKITSPSGRIYIGKTAHLNKRIESYKCNNCKNQKLLFASIKKYGFDNHVIEIIEAFLGTNSESNIKEIFWIDKYKSNFSKWGEIGNGLNLTDGGEGVKGVKVSEATKEKLRNSHQNNPNRKHKGVKWTKNHRDKVAYSKSLTTTTAWNKGKSYSHLSADERKQRFGKHHLGNTYNKGRKQSPERIKKHADILRGRPHPTLYKPVLQYDLNGFFINEYPSVQEAAKKSGMSRWAVSDILNGKIKKPRKYIFKFKTEIPFYKYKITRRIFKIENIKNIAA